MKEQLKNIAKAVSSKLGIHLTKNLAYDAQLEQVIKKLCQTNQGINTLDIGAHLGEISDLFLHYAPQGKHLLFEPIPELNEGLKSKYAKTAAVKIFKVALSNQADEVSFHHNKTNPAYSGLEKRAYPSEQDEVNKITVKTDLLDAVLENENLAHLDLIKIDVEGGELGVLEGAKKTIKQHRPIIIFEHGLGASEFYETTPEKVFDLLKSLHLNISTMQKWLENGEHLFSREDFCKEYYDKLNYYFIAYP